MKLKEVNYWDNYMSTLCNASLPEELVKVTEEKQLEDSWEVPGLQRNLEQSAEPLRKWELGQSKGLNPSVGFQHHRKLAFSPWSKATLCVLGPGQTSWKGPVFCSHVAPPVWCPQLGCRAGDIPDFPKKQHGGGFCRLLHQQEFLLCHRNNQELQKRCNALLRAEQCGSPGWWVLLLCCFQDVDPGKRLWSKRIWVPGSWTALLIKSGYEIIRSWQQQCLLIVTACSEFVTQLSYTGTKCS